MSTTIQEQIEDLVNHGGSIAKTTRLLTQASLRIDALERRNTTLASRVMEMEATESSAADLGRAAYAYYEAFDVLQAALNKKDEPDTESLRPLWLDADAKLAEFEKQRYRHRMNLAQQIG